MSRFDGPTAPLTNGAIVGGAAIAGALAAGWQNYRAALAERWKDWTLKQLQAALDCSEAMRFGLHCELNAEREKNAALARELADIKLTIKRAQARAAQARR